MAMIEITVAAIAITRETGSRPPSTVSSDSPEPKKTNPADRGNIPTAVPIRNEPIDTLAEESRKFVNANGENDILRSVTISITCQKRDLRSSLYTRLNLGYRS